MYSIQTLNAISDIIYTQLDAQFQVGPETENPQGILVRSASMHDMQLPDSLLAIARAGAGVNNIPLEACTKQGICVFNTPGANANAVSELVIAGLLLSARDLVGGIGWVQGLAGSGQDVPAAVEKGKSAFVGPELRGKKLGVIGLGAIGTLVSNAAIALGMEVWGFDPAISVEHAWMLSRSIHRGKSMEELLESCDYLSLHIPLNDKTRGAFGADTFARMKRGATLLNFSRGELVADGDVKAAVASGQLRAYVTDFPNEALLGQPHILTIPHLGASTPESEDNCAVMAAREVRDYLLHGTIRNSVNLPDVDLMPTQKPRLTVIHENIPNVLGSLTSTVAAQKINISDMTNRSRGDVAYTVLDLDSPPQAACAVLGQVKQVPGLIRLRALNCEG